MGAPQHWTYCEVSADDGLAQGDILERTDELVSLFRKVHAHFCDEKYLGFLVLTQTCDLVVRDSGHCKAHYLTLAVIRGLNAILPSLLAETCGEIVASVYDEDKKSKAVDLLSRILNQNEQALGIFYLYPDLDAGIGEHSIALLRITISFRAEHYNLLKRARVGRLAPQFSSKLGWLSGNLYSRVATQDWAEAEGGKQKLKSIIEQLLPPHNNWVSGKAFKAANKSGFDVSTAQIDDLRTEISKFGPADSKKTVLGRVKEIASNLFQDERDGKVLKLVARLSSDPAFLDAFKSR